MEKVEILSEVSYQELLDLLDWFYLHGPIPIVVGGWAVFFYNSYLGSVDIDLVGPSMGGLFGSVLEGFEISRGYEFVSRDLLGLETGSRKPVFKDGELVGYVEIDACTYESDQAGFHEDPEIRLPYALCSDPGLRTSVKLDGRREVFIPRKPLLFLYKVKALRDRSHDLRTEGAVMSASRRNWLQSKVVKDGSDLIALLDPEPDRYLVKELFDSSLFKLILETHNLHFVLDSLGELPRMKESLTLYSYADEKEVVEWMGDILKAV